MTKFLLIDDDCIFLHGLKNILQGMFSSTEMTLVNNQKEMQEALVDGNFDIALMDLQLRDGSSTHQLMHELREKDIRILIVSGTASINQLRFLVGSGALGYYDKAWPIERLEVAITAILQGQHGFSREIFDMLGNVLNSELPSILDEEELMVLAIFICDHGRTNKQIGRLVDGKSEAWIKAKFRGLCQRFEVSDRDQLAASLKLRGLIPEPDLDATLSTLRRTLPVPRPPF